MGCFEAVLIIIPGAKREGESETNDAQRTEKRPAMILEIVQQSNKITYNMIRLQHHSLFPGPIPSTSS